MVSSVLAVGEDDGHKYFIYYVPTQLVAYEWINEWVRDNFALMANRLGPSTVLVTAVSGREDDFRSSVASTADDLFSIARTSKERDGFGRSAILHSGFPFFIFSRHPLSAVRRLNSVDAIAVNLAAVENEQHLAAFVDSVINAAQAGLDDLLAAVPEMSKDLT
jgi:hypothetical protein